MIEFMSAGGFDQRQFADGDPAASSANVRDMGHLARSHQDITILFMDIVGEPRAMQNALFMIQQCGPSIHCPCHWPLLPVAAPGFTSMSKLVPPVAVMNFLNW